MAKASRPPDAAAAAADTAVLPERAVLLREAERLICGDRNATYGEPAADFERTAAIWSAMFDRRFTGHEVAMAMIGLKLSRLACSPGNQDSWADCAGYAGCGWEVAVKEARS